MIHHHLVTALNSGLSIYLDQNNQAAWLDLMSDTAHDDNYLIRVYNEIIQHKPQVKPYAAAGTASLPLVVAQQLSRNVRHRPLGGTANGKESIISQQEAKIEIMAGAADVCDVLSQTVYKIIQGLRKDFLANGYLSFMINSIDELAPHESLAAEELGIFVRRISLEAMIQEGSATIRPDTVLGTLTIGLAPQGKVRPI